MEEFECHVKVKRPFQKKPYRSEIVKTAASIALQNTGLTFANPLLSTICDDREQCQWGNKTKELGMRHKFIMHSSVPAAQNRAPSDSNVPSRWHRCGSDSFWMHHLNNNNLNDQNSKRPFKIWQDQRVFLLLEKCFKVGHDLWFLLFSTQKLPWRSQVQSNRASRTSHPRGSLAGTQSQNGTFVSFYKWTCYRMVTDPKKYIFLQHILTMPNNYSHLVFTVWSNDAILMGMWRGGSGSEA